MRSICATSLAAIGMLGTPWAWTFLGLNGANAFAPRGSENLQDLRVIGEDTLRGQPVIHVRGTLKPGTYSDLAMTEPAQVDIWIGRDDVVSVPRGH